MTLFARMLREEHRLHSRLFGSGRFLAFPAVVILLVAGGAWLLAETGTPTGSVVAGVHVLVAFLGLQVGTIGLVGRDAMRNVLGDVTLLVFSGRTLPISWRRLLATFLLKDLVYYAAFFVTPIALGMAPVLLAGGDGFATVLLLWTTIVGTFALGAGASLTAAGLAGRSKAAVVAVGAALGAGLVTGQVDLVGFTPYAAYGDFTPLTLVQGFLPALVLVVLAPLTFRPSAGGSLRSARRVERDFGAFADRLPATPHPELVVRPLLEVHRSSGSVWKVAFSLGILFAVTAFLLDRIGAATALDPSAGVAFGALLGLGTFTTYNWLTHLDDPREYLRYPVDHGAVLSGKLRAFLVLALPAGAAYLALAAVWYPVADLAVGLLVFPLVSLYVFGLTAYLTGLSPNELLFDTPLFTLYGAGLALVGVPLLVAALAAGTYPVASVGVALALSAVAALVGAGLARKSGPRWDRRLRRADR
ncbi:hypothetical protein ACKVMT_03255 [Halobacteriales archaeon Cl-PHB]